MNQATPEHTDAGGIVYHASHLRYMERARTELLRALGIEHNRLFAEGEGYYAVSALAIRYVAPARLDDRLLVRSRIEEVSAAACVIAQDITREGALISRATVTAAFLSPAGRPKRQPASLRGRVAELREPQEVEEDRGGD
jgi:acyl-CoA thioester hydrolase